MQFLQFVSPQNEKIYFLRQHVLSFHNISYGYKNDKICRKLGKSGTKLCFGTAGRYDHYLKHVMVVTIVPYKHYPPHRGGVGGGGGGVWIPPEDYVNPVLFYIVGGK